MQRLTFFVIFELFVHNVLLICQIDIPRILELFYEETGKYHTIDEIETFFKYPIEINKSNLQKISELLGISKKVANRIWALSKNGLTLDEICDSLDLLTSQCELLMNCTTTEKELLGKRKLEKNYSFELKSRVYTRFEKDSTYLGDSWDSFQRILFKIKNYSFGTSFIKDVGEKTYLDNIKYYAQYNDNNYSIIFGRFTFKSFWGNVLGEPYGTYKGASISLFSSPNPIKLKPTLSSLEYGCFNGLAFSGILQIKEDASLSISGFISDINRAGNYDTLLGKVTSVYTLDYFRTSSELRKKNALNEKSYFIQFISGFSSAKVGYSCFLLKYDKPIETSSNKFILGTNNLYHSFYFEKDVQNSLKISGEVTIDKANNLGVVSGLSLNFKKFISKLDFRYFSPHFRSPFGSFLGENSYPNNELGILYSCEISHPNVDIYFYADLFKSIVNTKYLQVPFYGQEIFIEAFIKPFPKFFLRLKTATKEKTDYIYNPQKTYQIPYQRTSYKILLENRLVPFSNFTATIRFDFVFLNNRQFQPNESGFHCSLQCEYNNPKVLKIGSRVNYFSTVSYSSAIYFFEIVAPEYMYTIPFYGTGLRVSTWIGMNFLESIDLFLRYSFEPNSRDKNFLLGQLNLAYSL